MRWPCRRCRSKACRGCPSSSITKLVTSTTLLIGRWPTARSRSCSHAGDGPFLTPRITRPVKGATLIGNGPDVLTRVSMVGKDLELDSGVGTCGKEGQSVPVGVGQPTLKIDSLTVGGTQA